ncbi:hypothetical protein SELMODRAFT_229405 [Selaginella moellendorffii]|uniref:SOUL heme-binding protein n=1 Tax=Selaginella moellendorffii TaxID=88036 RepID=D8SZU4_SELML|nr:uncharacterized protein LOC9661235 [Selaginella moellendorffii]EFJ10142.1 hypothetical protein SELMODRAFT_229405 [Selaginella moellendorffii]|eukprot:XP_002988880.1 uncharacterized protein LOC9661235 [Selaginella moellendorffii]
MATGLLPSQFFASGGRSCCKFPKLPGAKPSKFHSRVSVPRLSRRVSATATPVATDAESLVGFLEKDLPHLFDDQGIDRTRYEERVEFRDPITKYDTLSGYLFNLQLLRVVFNVEFILHEAKKTKQDEITTRWTMNMTFKLLPWKPVLLITGVSVMGVNLSTGRFRSHVDYWDSVDNNDYFSFEAVMDVLKQMRPFKTPGLETPKYTALKRTKYYEIRKYDAFLVVETTTDGLASSSGFNSVAGYIFGKNQREEKMKMTTPVFTARQSQDCSDVIQIVLPLNCELPKLPPPNSSELTLREVSRVYAAAIKFSGAVTEELVMEKQKLLRDSLCRDDLKPADGYLLARYNDPDSTPAFLRRNEVLIWLEDYHFEV